MKKEELDILKDFIKIVVKEAMLEFYQDGVPNLTIKNAVLAVLMELQKDKEKPIVN